MLGLATLGGPHLVILDEPTNHLDIDSRAALIAAINDFPGAVILVSHDRYLIEACADRLLLIADRKAAPFDGDLDDYRRFLLSGQSTPAPRIEIAGTTRESARRDAALRVAAGAAVLLLDERALRARLRDLRERRALAEPADRGGRLVLLQRH